MQRTSIYCSVLLLVGLLVGAQLPGRATAQAGPGIPIEWAEILSHMSIVELDDGSGNLRKTIRIEGVNLQIVNGLGATNGNPSDPDSIDPSDTSTNGLGNLIVGYNEDSSGEVRTGSHNVVLGQHQAYTSFGGLVGGRDNAIMAAYASVQAGRSNQADGAHSTVGGGLGNLASKDSSVVCGGQGNDALGNYSVIAGGVQNTTTASNCSVAGGYGNTASGLFSAVLAGQLNTASGNYSAIGGGVLNHARSDFAAVAGGADNDAAGYATWVGGGSENTASGSFSVVSGGLSRTTHGSSDWRGGTYWSDF